MFCRLPFLKLLSILLLANVVSISAYAAGDFVPFKGEINGEDVNVRADSTVSAQVLCRLNKGALVDVISESYDWLRIRLPKETPAYIRKDMVACIDKPAAGTVTPNLSATAKAMEPASQLEPSSQSVCRNAKVIKSDVNIRLMPDEGSWVAGKVQENQLLNIIEESGNFYKIIPPDNSFGWVHKKFIRKAEVAPAELSATELKEAQETGSEVVLTGQVLPYGRVFKRRTTHKLLTDDNKIFLLKNGKVNLDVLIGRKVKITGTLELSPKSKFPVIIIRSIEALKDQTK